MFLRDVLEEVQRWMKMARGRKKANRRLWEETITYDQIVTLF